MKKYFIQIFILLIFLNSCQEDPSQDFETTKNNYEILAKTELQKLPRIYSTKGSSTKLGSQSLNYPIDLSNPPRKVMINGNYISNFRYWFDDGVTSKVPTNIRKDILQKDGWEVFYNTIREYDPTSGQHTTEWPLIGLYNRYRGILRFFYYHPTNIQGNDIVGFLGFDAPNSTKLFNHPTVGESYPINISQKYQGTLGTTLSSDLNNISSGLAKNHWYCFEFDVSCYDPNLGSEVLTFAISSITKSELDLKGGLSGNISGTITGSVPTGGSLLSIENLITKNNNVSNTTNVNMEINNNNIDGLSTTLKSNADNSTAGVDTKNLFKGIVEDGIGALKKGVASFMSSGISGLFSSISSSLFGGNSPAVQQVKLSTKLDFKASGTITTTTTPFEFQFEIPKKIGLLNLDDAPTVQSYESVRLNTGLWNADANNANSYMITHLFRNTNCNVNINPTIRDEVNVYTSTDILYIEKSPDFNLFKNSSDIGVGFVWGKQKLPYNNSQIVGLDKNTEIWNSNIVPIPMKPFDSHAYQNYTPNNKNFIISTPLNNIYVKVNFKIVPKNGTDPFYLQKIYKAKVIENNTRNPFPSNWKTILNGTNSGIGDPGY